MLAASVRSVRCSCKEKINRKREHKEQLVFTVNKYMHGSSWSTNYARLPKEKQCKIGEQGAEEQLLCPDLRPSGGCTASLSAAAHSCTAPPVHHSASLSTPELHRWPNPAAPTRSTTAVRSAIAHDLPATTSSSHGVVRSCAAAAIARCERERERKNEMGCTTSSESEGGCPYPPLFGGSAQPVFQGIFFESGYPQPPKTLNQMPDSHTKKGLSLASRGYSLNQTHPYSLTEVA